MPFINAKLSPAMDKEKKESIKKKLGEAISLIPGKTESRLMIGIEDNCDLYYQGNQDDKSAYVEVSLFGRAAPEAYNNLTAEICKILKEDLDIPGTRVYVTYREVDHWGCDGRNF